jgi:hypothetical protein
MKQRHLILSLSFSLCLLFSSKAQLLFISGDSIADGWPLHQSLYDSPPAGSGDPNNDIAHLIYLYSGQTIQATNFAVNGGTTQWANGAYNNDGKALKPTLMWVHGGSNDPKPWTNYYFNLLFTACLSSNITMYVDDIMAHSDNAILTYNAAVANWVATNAQAAGHLYYFTSLTQMADPATSYTTVLPAYQNTNAAPHLSLSGTANLGLLLMNAIYHSQGKAQATATTLNVTTLKSP